MDKVELFKNVQIVDKSSPVLTVVCLLLTIICAYILKYVYENKSNSLSSKYQLSNIIPILSPTTFLVILIVKSSLALSLGLVGALSVVRFRTAVKEPVNLGFLLFTICVGIALGASQFLFGFITLLLGSIAIIFLYLKTGVKSQIDHQKDSSIDSISLTLPIEINLKEIFKILSEDCDFYDIQTFEQVSETKTCNLTFKVKFKSLDSLDDYRNKIKEKYKDANLIFFNSPVY